MKNYRIQFRGIGPLWTYEKPWAVIEYSAEHLPSAKIFATEKEANEHLMLKMLEQ
jgi:hypothetical protein